MDMIRKAGVAAGDGLEFILSDATVDRYGDIVEPDGWDLRNFKKNPIALFGHSSASPIGTWSNLRVEGGKLIGKLTLAVKGTSARLDELISLVEQRILRAVSVGFRPIESDPIDPKQPWGAQRYRKQELLEVSLVAVPANPAALQLAKSLKLSSETLSLAFGEHAETRRRDMTATGEHAETTSADRTRSYADRRPNSKDQTMTKTISQRLDEAQTQLALKQARHTELIGATDLDHDAIDTVSTEIETLERDVETLTRAESRMAKAAMPAPAVQRRPLSVPQPEVKPADLIVRAGVCHLLSHISGQPVERILQDRYPGDEGAAAVVQRTAIAVATTTTSGWASQLVETAMSEFLALLPANSIYPVLRGMGVGLTFGPNSGAIKIPFSSSTAALAGGFVLEGDPIPVGRMTLDSATLTPHKFGIIVPMTKEVMNYTNPALEAVVRSELLARTAIKLDSLLIDTTAGSATRPAGLRYNISAAGSAYGGGDYVAFIEDMKTLLSPFDTANAGRSLALLMNPRQVRNLRMLAGPNNSGFGWANQFLADFRVVPSTTVTAGMVIAIDTADFVTGTGDAPMFEASDQATIHMDDTPAAIVTATGLAASGVRSMFQTNSVALKMHMNVTWAMRRSGMVQWLENVTW